MNYEEILKQQVEAEREKTPTEASRPHTPGKIQKKVLVPLEDPDNVETEVKYPVKEPPPRVAQMAEMSTQSTETETTTEEKPTQPEISGIPQNYHKPNQAYLKSYRKEMESKKVKKGPSLFEKAMAPPPKPLQRTLFTYFDLLSEKE
ncbi:hypothetical protein TVAG_320030 [Trichomonas vaginalis G3]|uniref:Uncharacterized protein n=1 Tax=Trichomonas vaginalis (strain ATCC PRA-98 / G3) TaxID=412133 RepID=A2DQF1_TRIV3|nr:hypothetical protein TVAGG3_1009890 [Trichomonas vaginalis G3]EAY17408.1 hypothetical protein TVAG_320030 [Trichomonas vaginalis G3]KAI5491418.1 hypothetical protein TVAGG3_1009890 [Trichomonas vaginalis G3]|eukprot:XP_001330777.1 hypothetical protein [Trichomonas vaginalis G3]